MKKDDSAILNDLISEALKNPCETNLPRICEMIKTEEGREVVSSMIFTYCKTNGVSVQTAMAHVDSEI